MDERDKLTKELEKELLDALYEAYPESIDVHKLAMTHFRLNGVEPIWDRNAIDTEYEFRLKYRRKLVQLKEQGDVIYNENEIGELTGMQVNQHPDYNISPFSEKSLNVRMTSKRYEELKPKPAPIDRSIHFYESFKGNASTGDGATQTFTETTKSDKPKWLTLSFYWEEMVKYKFRLIIIAVAAALSTWIGFFFTKDKESSKTLPSQENNQQLLQTDTTAKKDSVAQ